MASAAHLLVTPLSRARSTTPPRRWEGCPAPGNTAQACRYYVAQSSDSLASIAMAFSVKLVDIQVGAARCCLHSALELEASLGWCGRCLVDGADLLLAPCQDAPCPKQRHRLGSAQSTLVLHISCCPFDPRRLSTPILAATPPACCSPDST